MDIKTIGDLAKLADICRKKGIEQIKISAEGIEFRLGEKPRPKTLKAKDSSDKIETDPKPSEEDILYWSSAGIPGEAH